MYFSSINSEKKERKRVMSDKLRHESEEKKDRVKKARMTSYIKRLETLGGIQPTQGLVSGDFCNTDKKTPVIGKRKLLKRRHLWNRCLHLEIPVTTRVFNWATMNNKLEMETCDIIKHVDHEEYLFDKVASCSGNEILSFLEGADKKALININSILGEEDYSAKATKISPGKRILCEKIGNILDIPFFKVLDKLDNIGGTWIEDYIYFIKPERAAAILEPHLLPPDLKKAMLQRYMMESSQRWGLNETDMSSNGRRIYADIVDVEMISAWYFMKKFDPSLSDFLSPIKTIMQRIRTTPGLTWKDATISYIAKLKETRSMYQERVLMNREDKLHTRKQRTCVCGQLAAMMCPYALCGDCCTGPCDRHSK